MSLSFVWTNLNGQTVQVEIGPLNVASLFYQSTLRDVEGDDGDRRILKRLISCNEEKTILALCEMLEVNSKSEKGLLIAAVVRELSRTARYIRMIHRQNHVLKGR